MPKSKRKYVPSQSIRKLITLWEGSSMKTNNSFESEATMFLNYLEQAGIFDLMSQDELDGLFSYSYNVGNGNFAKRTLPHLVKLYNGSGTLENVLKNIYGKRDSEPGLPGLRARRKYERNLFARGYRNRISKLKPAKLAENTTTTTPEVNNLPQITLDITGQQQPLTADYPRKHTIQDLALVENNNIRYPTRKRSIENLLLEYYNGGRLIKKGQYGMPIYHKELYLEKGPVSEDDQIYKDLLSRVSNINFSLRPETRMDLTTLLLNERLSTYKPTKELQLASAGIKHPITLKDYLSTLPIVIPAAATAVVTAPEWGPPALATVSNPAFWGELLKDTGAYIAADVTSQGLTGKGIGAHVNNAIGLEEGHPVGELLSFGIANPTKKLISKGFNHTKRLFSPVTKATNIQAPNIISNETINIPQSLLITKIILDNGKIRLRLPSHNPKTGTIRELVLEPQGGKAFRVHVRIWDGKNAGKISEREIRALLDALYDTLPTEGEILVPETSIRNPGTRGTMAAYLRLLRDPRYIRGLNIGTIWYPSKSGTPGDKISSVQWSLVKAFTEEEQRKVIERAYNKVLNYLGSEQHIQQIMNSGVSREYATTIANELKENAKLIDLNKIKIDPNKFVWEGTFSGGRDPVLTGELNPSMSVGKMKWLDDEDYTIDAILHELGGHAATLGSLTQTTHINNWHWLGGDFLQYLDNIEKLFPHYIDVAAHNETLMPVVRPEVAEAIKTGKPIIENGRTWHPDKEYLEYLLDIDEYSARARAHNMGSSSDINELENYFTKESIENLKKYVWGFTPFIPLIPAVFTHKKD